MKLVDILALELKEWPEGVSGIEQDRRGSCLYQYTGPAISAYVESVADDADSAVVTRAQWQAAVDALKAEKVVEWNGEGLPPVGAVCENQFPPSGWKKVKIIAHDEVKAVFRLDDGYQESYFGGSVGDFRLIRTPEQIAAEERDREIADLYFTINWNEGRETWPIISSGRKADYAKAIDAGYRKFEIVDN